jgi:BirA family biotin operon repressor/biotin-[acetyl-CoA-carboxylase] ligase
MGLGANVRLKWPNDLMIETSPSELKKIGGILVQRQVDHVVVGIGINTDLQVQELPTENATSLSLLGIETSREALIADLIFQLENTALLASDTWLPRYTQLSSTIGTEVMVTRQSDSVVAGVAVNVLKSGALLLESPDGPVEVTSGDVEQLRPARP